MTKKLRARKAHIKVVQSEVAFLMNYSGCTRVQAMLALMKNGRVQGPFRDMEIVELLGITHSALKQADNHTKVLLNKTFKTELDYSDLLATNPNFRSHEEW